MQQTSAPVVTLRQVWMDYQKSRDLKPVTLRNYNQRLSVYLSDWLDLPITQITKDMVEQRHRSIEAKAMANSAFRTLRALLEYAHHKYEDETGAPILKKNPVRRLTEVRAWHRDRQRRRVIPIPNLRRFIEGCYQLSNTTTRDYLLLLLFTGMRRSEGLDLQWSQVDLSSGTINLSDTKNGEDVSLPMSDFVWRLLRTRQIGRRGDYVFPGSDPAKPFTAAWNGFESVRVHCGVMFSLHDLRRTFVTVADELDLKQQVVQQLVNHKNDGVTEGYTVRSIERLRRATQKIADAILRTSGFEPGELLGNGAQSRM
jgi:integrase